MTLTPNTKHTYHVDAMNVHYFKDDETILIDTATDDEIEIVGVKPSTMAMLVRNLCCANDPLMNKIDLDDAQAVRQLNEARVALEDWWKEKTQPKPIDDDEIERSLRETYGG